MPDLILSGGTGKNNEKEINSSFLKKSQDRILYIPLAMESKLYSKCYDWITSQLPNQEIDMLISFTAQKIDLKKYSGIYIGGGNTFKLLKELKESNFDEKLKKFKGIIYGGSAGAIIWGKDISTASFGTLKDKNKVKLQDLSGFNLVNDYNIHCHYSAKEKTLVEKHVQKTQVPIIALEDDSGIYVSSGKIKPIGKVKYFEI